jgi:hypothetical protein
MNFIKRFELAIETHKKINSSSGLYIKNKSLKIYHLDNIDGNIDGNILPIQCFLGNVYLIKGDNIIEFYTYIDIKHSHNIQINKYSNIRVTNIYVINIESNDPENLNFILCDIDKIYCMHNMQYLINLFLDSGFMIYLKQY